MAKEDYIAYKMLDIWMGWGKNVWYQSWN